jgi:putative transposase
MPRITRGLVSDCIYHILNRGNAKQNVFYKTHDYEAFIKLMREAKEKYIIKLFAYCLMPNHFHMLIMVIQPEEFIKYMHWLMTSHVRRYHSHYGTSGHIWQGRYKSFIIQKDNHFLTVLKYILRNPVRAGLTKTPAEWQWSSYKSLINKSCAGFVDELPIDLSVDWRKYIDMPLTEDELAKLRNSVTRGAPYGEVSWQRQMSKELGLVSTLMPRGRPRKKRKVEDLKK